LGTKGGEVSQTQVEEPYPHRTGSKKIVETKKQDLQGKEIPYQQQKKGVFMLKPNRFAFVALLAGLILATAVSAAEVSGKVNLNTATAAQLELLPGVGPSLAGRILEHRKQNGSFKAVEDLLLVRGIGQASLERMKPYLALSGETTLREKVRLARPARTEKTAKN
jgi:competence protein ComEA